MEVIDDIKLFELLAFGAERAFILFHLIMFKKLSAGVVILPVFAFPNFLYLSCFVWRIFEKLPLIDTAIFSSKEIGGMFWIEKLVFWIERVMMLLMSVYGISTWLSMLLACVLFVSSNLMYLQCFIDNFNLKKKAKIEQLRKKEAESEGTPKEEIGDSNKNETPPTITNESVVVVSSRIIEKNDENSHKVTDGNGEKTADKYEEEEEEEDDDDDDDDDNTEDDYSDDDQEEEEEQPPKKKNRGVEDEDEDRLENDETMEEYSLTEQLYEDMQLLRSDLDNLREENLKRDDYWGSEMKKIKSEHEEQRLNWEQEKNDIAGKLCATTAMSEVYQSLVRERVESCLKLEEQKNDLAAKLCATTALSEVNQILLREKEESCRKFEEQKNDLAAKLCAATASYQLYQGLLHDLGY